MDPLEPPSLSTSQLYGQRPLSTRAVSQVIMPPRTTKEPAILTSWGAKSPSLRTTSHYSQNMDDSLTSRHMLARSPLSATSFPRPDRNPLTADDIDRMFSGAPQIEVVTSSLGPRPRFTIQGRTAADPEATNDFLDSAHPTFTSASCMSDELNDAETCRFDLREVPEMHSLTGRDAGTIGFVYYLQMPISDSKLTDEGQDTMTKRVELLFAADRLGLQPWDLASIIDRLSELGDAHESRHKDIAPGEQKAAEMYTELFSKLLLSPKFSNATQQDPTGVEVQIAALTEVLDATDTWYDFGYVEWRIRLGQLLWSEPDVQSEHESSKVACQRDVVLLQITLACELLIRLNMSEEPLKSRHLSRKVKWDLVLAQRFLENVRITQKPADETQGNRSSVFSAMSFFTANESLEEMSVEPIMYPRHERRQVDGLVKFAEILSWPHTEDIKSRFHDRTRRHSLLTPSPVPTSASAIGAYATALATPGSMPNTQADRAARPQVGRTTTAQSMQLLPASAYGSESLDAGGWMSRSWLTGLVLPGEAASHFLIATLLENSPRAIKAIGDSADLYGGFVYSGRSYWSKWCVVGRVLAAQKGAADCMGWICSPSMPANSAEGWVNVETKELPSSSPPISVRETVAGNSAFIRSNDDCAVEEDDFIWPLDSPPVMGNEARYEGMTLQPTDINFELSPEQGTPVDGLEPLSTSTVYLNFTSKSSKRMKMAIPLLYDVHFVSSLPCFPENRTRVSSSRNSLHPPCPTDEKELPDTPCHPLHSGYSMEVVPAATLLSCAEESFQGGEQTLVLDCRGSNELEMMSRAWCAKIGENALVGKTDRTCLSCCVREACGLGLRIVIRI